MLESSSGSSPSSRSSASSVSGGRQLTVRAPLLLRLYPSWRARYGDEFAALLEERPLGPFDVADVVLGALDAHRTSAASRARPTTRRIAMSFALAGFAAIRRQLPRASPAGAASSADVMRGHRPGALVHPRGHPPLLVALVGLCAFQDFAIPTRR